MKICCICKVEKAREDFHRKADSRDGLCAFCKQCKSERRRSYYVENKEHIKAKSAKWRADNPERSSETKKASRIKKIETYKARSRQRYADNRAKVLAYQAEYRKKNWPAVLAWNTTYKRERLRSDPLFRLEYAVRGRTLAAFREKGFSKGSKTMELLGCDWPALKAHMEAQFQTGMSWDNRGDWHIDHIIPLASAKTVEDLERLCHYTNLQPLWAADNIRKGAKIAA